MAGIEEMTSLIPGSQPQAQEIGPDGIPVQANLGDMKTQGAINTAAQWGKMGNKLGGPVIGGLAAGAGALYGHSNADFAFRDANRVRNTAVDARNSSNVDAATLAAISGASTLPKSNPTQIQTQNEPIQSTQATDQLTSLGLA
tara:strand:- start:562 stop:990 length:429 start_codon:yes stop_codon:yes gene_type:complete